MAKRTQSQKGHSGDESKLYSYKGSIIRVLPYFLYEVKVYKYSRLEFIVLGSKYYKSDTLLSIKFCNTVKYYDGYSIEHEISLVGTPEYFIKENNLQEYKPIVKKLKKRKK